MTQLPSMSEMNLSGQRVLIREDLNVPMSGGKITNDARIKAAIPTIQMALQKGAQVLIMSHLGRPKEGVFDPEFSLAPVAAYLEEELGRKVPLIKNWSDGLSQQAQENDVMLLENVRFLQGEKANDEQLAKQMAALCDVFVMDAFGTAHRAQASTEGVARFAPKACAGPLLIAEIEALEAAMKNPKAPMVAVVGGSKVSTKLTVLKALAKKVDLLIVGGGIANTFLAAKGHSVGKSLCEMDLLDEAKSILELTEVFLPSDVVVAKEFSATATAAIKSIEEVAEDEMILDIGPDACHRLHERLLSAGTIVWNGPLGVFEFEPFATGTKILSEAIGNSAAFSLAGGGDTLAAIDQFNVADQISYISTGGGAFLEYLEGRALPAVVVLQNRVE